jgi:hypothetical protein
MAAGPDIHPTAPMHKNTVGRSRWAITKAGHAANYANVSVENRARTRR